MTGYEPKDQASLLREQAMTAKGQGAILGAALHAKTPTVLAIASGKGGVGKSSVAVNVAFQLGRLGKRVLVFDADFGLGNVDILLGIVPQRSLVDAVESGRRLDEIAVPLENNVTLIPAGSSHFRLANASSLALEHVFYELETFARRFDVVLVDTGAGIGERVRDTLLVAQHVIIVTTPDPTAVTDSYATIKVVSRHDASKRFGVVVNMVESARQAEEVFLQLSKVTKKFLGLEIGLWGHIPFDKRLQDSVRRQRAVSDCYPGTAASLAFQRLAAALSPEMGEEQQGKFGVLLRQIFGHTQEPDRTMRVS